MDSQWLNTQFAVNPDKTKNGLAAAVGLSASAISKILNGTRQIKAQEYIQMRQFFGLPSDGHATQKHSSAKGSGLNEKESLPPDWIVPATMTVPSSASGTVRIVQVGDNFMEPEFRRGESVLVDVMDRKPSSPGLFIVSDGFTSMLRHCALAKNGDILIEARREFQTQTLKADDFLIIGRVIAKLQMI